MDHSEGCFLVSLQKKRSRKKPLYVWSFQVKRDGFQFLKEIDDTYTVR